METTLYNNRLQAYDIKPPQGPTNLIWLQYGYGGTNNNGNVLSQNINAPGLALTQNYGYDLVNRLLSASESVGGTAQWSQSYTYDVYGNRAVGDISQIPL